MPASRFMPKLVPMRAASPHIKQAIEMMVFLAFLFFTRSKYAAESGVELCPILGSVFSQPRA